MMTMTMVTMAMVTMTMTMVMTTTLARILLSGLVDEVDDAGSGVGIAPAVHGPRTEKRRYLAGRGCTPGDPVSEGESVRKHSELPVCVMSQCDLCVDAVIDKEIGGLCCCRYQCQRQHDSEEREEVSGCHWPPSGRITNGSGKAVTLEMPQGSELCYGSSASLRLSAHAEAAVNRPEGGLKSTYGANPPSRG